MILGIKTDFSFARRFFANEDLVLMVASGLVLFTRYAGVFANASGFHITGWLWNILETTSGFGMAIVEPYSLFFCFKSLSRYRKLDALSILLLVMLVVSMASLALMCEPFIMSASFGVRVVDFMVLSPPPNAYASMWRMELWATAVTVATILLLPAAGIASYLKTRAGELAEAPAPSAVESTQLQVIERPVNRVDRSIQLTPAAQRVYDACSLPISLVALAAGLGVSRQAVWGQATKLKKQGLLKETGDGKVVQA